MNHLRIVAALAAFALAQGSASADSIFFTDNSQGQSNSIFRANTDGTGFQQIYSVAPGSGGGIFSLSVDDRNQHLYWTERFTGLVRRSGLDGSGTETVFSASGGFIIEDFAVDSLRGHIYSQEFDTATLTNAIVRYNIDGTNRTSILDGIFAGDYLDLDEANGTLYFSDSSDISGTFGTYRVRSANLDGSGVQTLLSDLDNVTFVEADSAVGLLYVGSGFEMRRMNLDGTGLLNISEYFNNLAIDPSGMLYGVRGLTGSKIVRSGLDASNLSPIPGLENFDSYNIAFASSAAAVPEPSSLALAGLAVVGLTVARQIAGAKRRRD